jgi:hypothetical protein
VQLDNTRIAIRERGLLEILDLSLHVIWRHRTALFWCFAVVVVPLMLLNWWLIGWMADGLDPESAQARYFWVMTLLVFIETPLAAVPTTLYLGRAMFRQQTSVRQIIGDAWKLLPQLLICQVFVRGIGGALFLVGCIELDAEFTAMESLLILLAIYLAGVRAFRPYLNEIILLERNPLHAQNPKIMTVGRRSAALHGPSAGDLFSRWLGAACILTLMALTFVCAFWFVFGTFLNSWTWGPVMIHVCVPLSMWLVAGFSTVARFLCYLDLRIRREGWEVELRIRAEGARIARQLS